MGVVVGTGAPYMAKGLKAGAVADAPPVPVVGGAPNMDIHGGIVPAADVPLPLVPLLLGKEVGAAAPEKADRNDEKSKGAAPDAVVPGAAVALVVGVGVALVLVPAFTSPDAGAVVDGAAAAVVLVLVLGDVADAVDGDDEAVGVAVGAGGIIGKPKGAAPPRPAEPPIRVMSGAIAIACCMYSGELIICRNAGFDIIARACGLEASMDWSMGLEATICCKSAGLDITCRVMACTPGLDMAACIISGVMPPMPPIPPRPPRPPRPPMPPIIANGLKAGAGVVEVGAADVVVEAEVEAVVDAAVPVVLAVVVDAAGALAAVAGAANAAHGLKAAPPAGAAAGAGEAHGLGSGLVLGRGDAVAGAVVDADADVDAADDELPPNAASIIGSCTSVYMRRRALNPCGCDSMLLMARSLVRIISRISSGFAAICMDWRSVSGSDMM